MQTQRHTHFPSEINKVLTYLTQTHISADANTHVHKHTHIHIFTCQYKDRNAYRHTHALTDTHTNVPTQRHTHISTHTHTTNTILMLHMCCVFSRVLLDLKEAPALPDLQEP